MMETVAPAGRFRLAPLVAALLVAGCAQNQGGVAGGSGGHGSGGTSGAGGSVPWPGSGGSAGTGTGGTSAGGAAGAPGTEKNAFIDADAWSIFWNDRTRCGAERTFLDICQHRGGDCSLYQQAYNACDPTQIVYGQVGPEKQSQPLCQQSVFPSVGGCIAANYDFNKLRFYWYGAEWEGNWPWATIKVFKQGDDWKGGGELVAISTLPGLAQAAMGGIQNHGLGHGCTMSGVTSGSGEFTRPFGAFAWVEVPAGQPLTIAVVSSDNFGDHAFAGCQRGAATQTPWVTSPPGAQLGCVYVTQNVVLDAGKHYFWQYGNLTELPTPAPPKLIVDAFNLPGVGIDVTNKNNCQL